jgi:arginase
MTIEIIGAPFDLGGRRLGSRLGPSAVRMANLEPALRSLGVETRDHGDIAIFDRPSDPSGFRGFESLLPCIQDLRRIATSVLAEGRIPLLLGGEHTLAVGGVAAALEFAKEGLGLLWIDAHADVNTPATSGSGNLHGMPVAALQGLEAGTGGEIKEQWSRLLNCLGPTRLASDQVSWYGLRDVDAPERARVRQGFGISMHEIDRWGIEETVRRLDRYWRDNGRTHLWISFDVDSLDPILAPGTGTAVRGGLSYREAHLLAELLRERMNDPDCHYRLLGLDLVETNPIIDTGNETAKMAVEWIASLFGKTILGDL